MTRPLTEPWKDSDGFVIIDFSPFASNRTVADKTPGRKVEAIAKLVLKPEKINLIACSKAEDDSWKWKQEADAKSALRSIFGQYDSSPFLGTIVVIIPEELSAHVRFNIGEPLYDCIAIGQRFILAYQQATVRKRQRQTWEPNDLTPNSRSTADLAVLLWRLVATSGRAMLCCSAPSENYLHSILPSDQIGRSGFIDEINFNDASQVSSYFRTALLRIAYKISPAVGEKPKGDLLATSEAVSNGWDFYSIQPKQAEYEDLLRQELGSRELAGAFLRLCGHAFGKQAIPYTLLPADLIVAIGALRVSRRLANWTLEGDSFCCSIAIFSSGDFDALGSGTSAFSPIIDIEPDIPFNFPHQDDIRKAAEAAQGEGLFLLVDATSGLLKSIGCHNRANSHDRLRRHAFLGSLVARSGVLIHIRDQGFVEVYIAGNLCFWNDGFEWQYYPYQELESVFEEHFSLPAALRNRRARKAKSRNYSPGSELIRITMLDAVRRLLDRRSSSIIILLDAEDQSILEEVAHEQLREELVWAKNVAKIYVDEVDADALAGLLAVDGAHIVDATGRLTSIARRLDAPRLRYAVPIQARQSPHAINKEENASLIKQSIDRDQRYEEFAVRRVGVHDWELKIYGIIDEAKWKSLSELSWIKDDPALATRIEKQIFRDMCWCIHSTLPIPDALADKINLDAAVMEQLSSSVAISGVQNSHISLVFSDERPVDGSQPIGNIQTLLQAVKTHLSKATTRIERCFAVSVNKSDRVGASGNPSEVLGSSVEPLEFMQSFWWLVRNDSLKRAAKTRGAGLPQGVRRRFRDLLNGSKSQGHAGTGTRAATEVANALVRSTVVKVSASGGVKILRR